MPRRLRKITPPVLSWVALRRGVQYGALFLFLALLVAARRGGWPPEWVNVPLRLDPLVILARTLAARALPIGWVLVLLLVLLTLVLGRAWCGWLCPMGTLLGLFRPRPRPSQWPETWRRVKHLLWLIILLAALLGNLTLLVLDPLTLLIRTFSTALWPAADQVVTAAERTAYRIPWLRPPVEWVDRLLRPAVLPTLTVSYRAAWLYALVLVAILALNGRVPYFWCRYLCPLGGLLGLMSKGAMVRREVTAACNRCGLCANHCPTGTIRADRQYASDPAECTMCMECREVCPQQAVRFSAHLRPASWETYDPRRRDVLLALGIAILGVGILRRDPTTRRRSVIYPPGARGDDLAVKCVRCGLCARACPTGAIQPSLGETGFEGLWLPVLIPRLGYCDYSCRACGQVCPVQAIPPMSLDEKQRWVIGIAFIDRNRCIPWSSNRPCIVCEEMCPVPKKAIILEETPVTDAEGRTSLLQRPRVVQERCIGCGVCEYKCPVSGEAAIRVQAVPNL